MWYNTLGLCSAHDAEQTQGLVGAAGEVVHYEENPGPGGKQSIFSPPHVDVVAAKIDQGPRSAQESKPWRLRLPQGNESLLRRAQLRRANHGGSACLRATNRFCIEWG